MKEFLKKRNVSIDYSGYSLRFNDTGIIITITKDESTVNTAVDTMYEPKTHEEEVMLALYCFVRLVKRLKDGLYHDEEYRNVMSALARFYPISGQMYFNREKGGVDTYDAFDKHNPLMWWINLSNISNVRIMEIACHIEARYAFICDLLNK